MERVDGCGMNFIDPTSLVTGCRLGNNVRIGPFCCLKNCIIGDDVQIFQYVNAYDATISKGSKIGSFVEIQASVKVGAFNKISSHSFLCSGVTTKKFVFIGHGVMFINDNKNLRAAKNGKLLGKDDWKLEKTLVKDGVSIGSNSTIMGNLVIRENTLVGAHSFLNSDTRKNSVYYGVPAKYQGKRKT